MATSPEQRVTKLWAALHCLEVAHVNAAQAAAQAAEMRANWREYGQRGQTYRQYCAEACTHNQPKPGYCYTLELNDETVAVEYGFASYEAAVLACARRYGPRGVTKPGGMLREVLQAALTDWWYAASHMHLPKVYEPGSHDRLNQAHYLQTMREWWVLIGRKELPRLAQCLRLPYDPAVYGEVCHSELTVVQWQHEVGRWQFEQLRAMVGDVVPLENLRAMLAEHGVTCKLAPNNKRGEWHWYDKAGEYGGWGVNERGALMHACIIYGLLGQGFIYGHMRG